MSGALQAHGIDEIIIHTGQHYDEGMSDVFFREFGIPAPKHSLGLGGGNHGAMTGRMLERIEHILIEEKPAAVLVYGDTNSTLAGALAAAKLGIPVAHVEAGLRSFNRTMPEEINRVCTDHLSKWLYCSSEHGAARLRTEGISQDVIITGDVMADVFYRTQESVCGDAELLDRVGALTGGEAFDLMTMHRADTVSDPERLVGLVRAAGDCGRRVLLVAHPRTGKILREGGNPIPDTVTVLEPAGYREMVAMLARCARVITDSGGLQKEAYWARRRCITLRTETEWVETVETGWNTLAGVVPGEVSGFLQKEWVEPAHPVLYGDGHASARIASHLKEALAAI